MKKDNFHQIVDISCFLFYISIKINKSTYYIIYKQKCSRSFQTLLFPTIQVKSHIWIHVLIFYKGNNSW